MKKKYFTEEERQIAKKIKEKEYYQNNKEKLLKKQKEWKNNHKEEKKKYQKEWRKNHKEERSIYHNNKLKTDINYKLAYSLRRRLRCALYGNAKSGSAVKDLGCSIPELKIHLESKFQEGMTWDNWSYTGWHIDHVVPLDSFNLQNREEFLKACHYTNLQPLWAEENLKKNNKEY